MKIAENIRFFRKEQSFTQEQLAEMLGVTVGAVYKWEAGLSVPEIKLIMEMADLFEVSVDVLLGYEQQSSNLEDMIARIKQYRDQKETNFAEVIATVEKALKKYPNNFEVVYHSGILYQVKFVEDRDEKSIEKSNVLLKRAITLLYQNTDKDISEVTISNSIAENYIFLGESEKALELLKRNNVCGINNAGIGMTYTMLLNQPKEAMPYLVESFVGGLNIMLHTMIGLANTFEMLEEKEKSLDALLWLSRFLEHIKVEKDSITYADKLNAAFWAECAVMMENLGHSDEAREYIRKAYMLAKSFDEAPVFDLQGIRFCEGKEAGGVLYDDLGSSAVAGAEKLLYSETEDKAYRFVQEIWEELRSEENKE